MWDKFIELGQSRGDQLAIVGSDRSITYRDLVDQVIEGAVFFQNHQLSQAIVGISLSDKIDEVLCALSVLLSGNAYFFIPEKSFADALIQVPLGMLIADREANFPPQLLRANWSEIEKIKHQSLIPWWINEVELDRRPFCVYATSASTGRAKYVLHDYASITEDTFRQIEENQITDRDCIDFLFAASFSSSLASIFPALFTGARLAVFDIKDSSLSEVPHFWKASQATFATLTCSAFRAICHLFGESLKAYISTIRFLCLGGEAVLPSDLEYVARFFSSEVILQLAYASTETRTMGEIKLCPGQGQLTIPHDGFPVRKKDLILVPTPENPEVAEIEIRSKHICVGLWENGVLNPLPVVKGKRVFRTGDLAKRTQDGGIKLLGRNQSRVKVNGLFVDLSALESEITSNAPYPCACKILVLRDGKGMEFLAAFLEMINPLSAEEKQKWKSSPLSIAPRQWIFLDQFPLNSHGKIDRAKLEAIAKEQVQTLVDQELNDPVLQTIYAAWAEELGNSNLGLDDDFFSDLGGSSLGAEILMGELSQKLGKNLPTQLIYTHRTIRKLGEKVQEDLSPSFPFLEWKKRSSENGIHLVFIEVGHFDSFQAIIDQLRSSDFSILTLRYDLYQVTEGVSAEDIIEKCVSVLRSLGPVCLVGVSFNGWLAAKIAERMESPVVILDSPSYLSTEGKILNRSALNRISYAWNQFQSKGAKRVFPELTRSFGKLLMKKVGINVPKSLFQRSVETFLIQSTPVDKLKKVLYIYSNLSMITSEKDMDSWKRKTVDNFELYRIQGDHLDSCSEKFGATVAGKMTEFLENHKELSV